MVKVVTAIMLTVLVLIFIVAQFKYDGLTKRQRKTYLLKYAICEGVRSVLWMIIIIQKALAHEKAGCQIFFMVVFVYLMATSIKRYNEIDDEK